MFSLIITIISIALVAALALATLYYGGAAFNQGRAAAHASTLINQALQIEGAWHLAKANGESFATITAVPGPASSMYVTELVAAGYLATVPSHFQSRAAVHTDGHIVLATAPTDGSDADFELAVCNVLQEKAGGGSFSGYADMPADSLEFMTSGQKFGCHQDEGALVRFVLN